MPSPPHPHKGVTKCVKMPSILFIFFYSFRRKKKVLEFERECALDIQTGLSVGNPPADR